MMASFPLRPRSKSLPLGIAAVDRILPEAGLPSAGVVEIAAPNGLARTTKLALSAIASAQARARNEGGSAWCSWIDASGTLFAPGVARAGVDLDHLLVVRPEPEDIARIAVRITASSVFSVVVVDRCGVPGSQLPNTKTRWNIAVRRLALAAENNGTTILLLSTSRRAREQTLPTAMRLELSRPNLEQISMCVAKDRRGRSCEPVAIAAGDLLQAG